MVTNLIKCPECGFEWKYRPGLQGRRCYYYCNRCGKEKAVILDLAPGIVVDLAADYETCSCGGMFTLNNSRIICPVCKNDISIM